MYFMDYRHRLSTRAKFYRCFENHIILETADFMSIHIIGCLFKYYCLTQLVNFKILVIVK